MKKILYIYHTSTIGGGSYCLLNILRTVDRSIVCPIVLLKEDGPLVTEIKALDIPVYFLPTISTVPYNVSTFTFKKIKNAIRLVNSFSRYKSILKAISPDIVYLNTMMLYPYLRPAKEMGIKTIIHIREHWSEGEHRWQRNTALKHIDRFADQIIAINTYSASMLEFSTKPKTIVYDWIDLSCRFKEIPLSSIFNENMTNKKVYFYMGGMQSIKGAFEVISSFSEIITDPNARLLAMGFNDQGYNRGWKGKIKKLMAYMGFAPYTEKVMQLINADSRIKCIPSEYMINHIVQQAYCILSYFTVPHANLALAESIILGTPSIAADTEESREYSQQGKLASLFKMNNILDFHEKIKQFDSIRPTLIKELEMHSIKIVEMFDTKRNSKLLNDIYKQM